MQFNRFLRISAVVLSMLAATSSVFAGGMPENGKKIAQVWCASCHVISEDQVEATSDVPSFKFIADKYKNNIEAAAVFLADPHPRMPDLNLTRNEIQDLLAYIESLN